MAQQQGQIDGAEKDVRCTPLDTWRAFVPSTHARPRKHRERPAHLVRQLAPVATERRQLLLPGPPEGEPHQVGREEHRLEVGREEWLLIRLVEDVLRVEMKKRGGKV